MPADLVAPCLDELAAAEGVVREPVPRRPVRRTAAAGTGRAVYLLPFHRAERSPGRARCCACSARPADRLAGFAAVDWDKALGWLRSRTARRSSPRSRPTAVRLALTAEVAVLTGGPGCGKSLHRPLHRRRWPAAKGAKIVLAAPTGRAAKRLAELTGHDAATIHRLLQLRPGGDPPSTATNPWTPTWWWSTRPRCWT